jgi:hypothetical protein
MRIYTAAIDIADAGTDADQDIFELVLSTGEKSILHEFELYSDATAAAVLKLELVRRSTTGTGGTGLTEEEHDPGNTVTTNVTASQTVTAPGTISGGALKNFYWEQLGPLIYRPAPEDRIVWNNTLRLALHLGTNPANVAIGGYVTWEDL